jgi:aerobic-type carbon monoxide dehydrogenase small subunit (CoxS/CutS family)
MNCHALLSIHPDANESIMEEWLQANICRCTGFEEIKTAVKSVQAGNP